MIDALINLYAKAKGITGWVMDALPLLGAAGGILGSASSILVRASAVHDPAGLLHAIHPTAEEAATFAVSWGVLKAHFNHQANAAKLEDHAQSIGAMSAASAQAPTPAAPPPQNPA